MERKYTKAEAGALGARRRWGDEPRVIRLDDLTSPQRRLVLALVDAARKEAASTGENVETAQEARRVVDERSPAA